MIVTFYTFSKKKNSTAQPSSDGVSFDCLLKEASGILSPTIEIQLMEKPLYNYCYIEEFTRYYYIKEWTYYRGLWTASAECDVLATFKPQIVNTTAFVVRSSSSYNPNIIDNVLYQMPQVHVTATIGTGNFLDVIPTDIGIGILLIFCINGDINAKDYGGFSSVYMISSDMMAKLVTYLCQNQSIWEEFKQLFSDVCGAITGVRFIPLLVPEDLQGRPTALTLGRESTEDVYVRRLRNKALYTVTEILTIPWAVGSDFRRYPPYTEAQLFLPFVGLVPINLLQFSDDSSIVVKGIFDYINGSALYQISRLSDDSAIVATYSADIGIDLPIATSSSGVGNIGNAISSTASVITNPLNIVNAVIDIAMTAGISYSGGGMTSGSSRIQAGIFYKPYLFTYEHDTNVSPESIRSVMGSPLLENVQLSSLSGYVQTRNASVSAPGFDSEISTINTMLDSGVFIE